MDRGYRRATEGSAGGISRDPGRGRSLEAEVIASLEGRRELCPRKDTVAGQPDAEEPECIERDGGAVSDAELGQQRPRCRDLVGLSSDR